jgi:hypothetical protein
MKEYKHPDLYPAAKNLFPGRTGYPATSRMHPHNFGQSLPAMSHHMQTVTRRMDTNLARCHFAFHSARQESFVHPPAEGADDAAVPEFLTTKTVIQGFPIQSNPLCYHQLILHGSC